QQLKPSTTLSATNVNQTYGYTTLNQVDSLNGTSYTYDTGDNLTTRGTATLAYDPADELSSQSSGATTTTYTYDGRGNRTQASVGASTIAIYGYDQANRLISYNASGASGPTTAQYTYNGDGLRQSKWVNGGASEQFTWDTAEGLPLLLQDGATQYIYGPGGTPIEQVGGNGTLYYLTDQLGSTRALVDAFGAVQATTTYGAYGALITKTGNLSASANPFGFAGQYTDTESGLVYLRARYYDPATAQFLTRDPLASLTQEPYGYARGNPLNGTDATGLYGFFDALGDTLTAITGFAAGAAQRASTLGSLLATSTEPAVRSAAAGLLRGAGDLSNNPAIDFLAHSKILVPLSIALSFAAAVDSGESVGKALAETTGSTAGGLLGAAAGGFICGLAGVATVGFGLLACGVFIGGLSYLGGKLGGYLGDISYDSVSNLLKSSREQTFELGSLC
ncbi:MAG TPA: RHS repeat-associated core domain-containing protein, partial [Ktedonobacterales bacterium]